MRLAALLNVFALALLHTQSMAESAKLLPYQGKLTGASGAAIPDGSKVVQFKIYDAPLAGQVVWNGEVQLLSINAGTANTILGAKSSLEEVDFNKSVFLEITIDANADNQITAADPPLLPRQSILPVIFAKEANNARELNGFKWSDLMAGGTNSPTGKISEARLPAGAVVPIGAVVMWWGDWEKQQPQGFEICDGNPVSTAGSPIFSLIKPNFARRFPRGIAAEHFPGRTPANVPQYSRQGGEIWAETHTTKGTALSREQMPAHTHGIHDPGHVHHQYSVSEFGSGGGPHLRWSYTGEGPGYLHEGTSTSHAFTGIRETGNEGASQPHQHEIAIPAYQEILFIIRVK